MSVQYQTWLCPPLRDTGIRVGQGGFHTVCELIGQSGWYAFERINTDGSVSHWFTDNDPPPYHLGHIYGSRPDFGCSEAPQGLVS